MAEGVQVVNLLKTKQTWVPRQLSGGKSNPFNKREWDNGMSTCKGRKLDYELTSSIKMN